MKLSNSARNLLRLAWLAAFAMVVAGSLLPESSGPIQALEQVPVSDKLEHMAGYAALAFLPALHEGRRRLVWMAIFAVAVGILIEFIQPSFGRDFEIGDMVADAGGVAAGLLLAGLLRRVSWSGPGSPGSR